MEKYEVIKQVCSGKGRYYEKQQIVAFVRMNGLSSCDNTL